MATWVARRRRDFCCRGPEGDVRCAPNTPLSPLFGHPSLDKTKPWAYRAFHYTQNQYKLWAWGAMVKAWYDGGQMKRRKLVRTHQRLGVRQPRPSGWFHCARAVRRAARLSLTHLPAMQTSSPQSEEGNLRPDGIVRAARHPLDEIATNEIRRE